MLEHIELLEPSATTSPSLLSQVAEEWKDPERRAGLIAGASALLLGLFALSTMVLAGYLAQTRQPLQDSWDLLRVRITEPNLWSFLWTPHNSHFIPVPRLLYLVDEKLFHYAQWSLLSLTFVVQFFTALLLFKLACRPGLDVSVKATVLGAVFAFVFAAPQWINYTSALQVCFILPIPLAIGAFAAMHKSAEWAAADSRRSAAWLSGSLALAVISVATSANGMAAWPLLGLQALVLRRSKRIVIGVAALTAGIAALYMTHYDPIVPRTLFEAFDRVPAMVVYVFAYLGSVLDEPLMALAAALQLNWQPYRIVLAAVAGCLGIAWFVYLVGTTVISGRDFSPRRVTLLTIASYQLGTAALTSFGRVDLTVISALASRYTTPSVLFWISLILLWIVPPPGAEIGPEPRRTRRLVATVLAGALVGGLIQLPKVTYAMDSGLFLAEGEFSFINGAFDQAVWERTTYSAGRIVPLVQFLRDNRLGPFTHAWARWIGEPVLSHFRVVPRDACSGGWEGTGSLGNSFIPSVLLHGWAYDRRGARPPHLLVIVDGANRILGFTRPTRRRKDIVQAHAEIANDRVGWVTYLPVFGVTDATIYTVSDDETYICPVASARLPAAFITAPPAKAGAELPGTGAPVTAEWVPSLPVGAAAPPFGGNVWSSHPMTAHSGTLRIGPVDVLGGYMVGLPFITGPRATGIRLSVIDRATKVTLAAANPPAGQTNWDLWRIDLPTGIPPMALDYLIERNGRGEGDWVVVGSPRFVAR